MAISNSLRGSLDAALASISTLTAERDSLLANYLPVDDGALYISVPAFENHTVTEYNNGTRSYYITRDPAGVFTASDDVPDTLILKPDHFPSLEEETDGSNVAFNFFRDNGRFNLQFRGTSGPLKNVEMWLQDVPYEQIPRLNLPSGWTYETGPNPSTSGFNHLFKGQINGFSNVNISGGTTTGDDTQPRIYTELV